MKALTAILSKEYTHTWYLHLPHAGHLLMAFHSLKVTQQHKMMLVTIFGY